MMEQMYLHCSDSHGYQMRILNCSEATLGTCSEALDQLIIVGAHNKFPNTLLISPQMSALLEILRSFPVNLRLFSFSLGIFPVVRIVICLPVNFSDGMCQVNRTTWASVECFVAAFVANIFIFNTLRRKPKSNRHYRHGRIPCYDKVSKSECPATKDTRGYLQVGRDI